MSEITAFPADGTAVLELPRMCPFGSAVSWRLVHGVGWVISLCIQALLTQSVLFHWRSFCLQFQYFLVFGLLGTGYCNDRNRSRLRLVGKGAWHFQQEVYLFTSQQDHRCITVEQHCLWEFGAMGQAVPQCHSQPQPVHMTSFNGTCLCLYFIKRAQIRMPNCSWNESGTQQGKSSGHLPGRIVVVERWTE